MCTPDFGPLRFAVILLLVATSQTIGYNATQSIAVETTRAILPYYGHPSCLSLIWQGSNNTTIPINRTSIWWWYNYNVMTQIYNERRTDNGLVQYTVHIWDSCTVPTTMPTTVTDRRLDGSPSAVRLRVGDAVELWCSVSVDGDDAIVTSALPTFRWSWFECGMPQGDGSPWPNRAQCNQTVMAPASLNIQTNLNRTHRRETITWRPTKPGYVQCLSSDGPFLDTDVYLLDHIVPDFDSSADQPLLAAPLGGDLTLTCYLDKYNRSGQAIWQHNGAQLHNTVDGRVQIQHNDSGPYATVLALSIQDFTESAAGVYECATMDGDRTQVVYEFVVALTAESWPAYVIASTVVGMLLVSVGMGFYFLGHRDGLRKAGIETFVDGDMARYRSDRPRSLQAHLMPYDTSVEFPLANLHIRSDSRLGSGTFGVVYRAEAVGIEPHEPRTTVAVKMARSSDTDSAIRTLISELKIMTHVGRHENVLRLLGAVTVAIRRRKLYVISEFCALGNLEEFLRKNQANFVDLLGESSDSDKTKRLAPAKDASTPLLANISTATINTDDLLTWCCQAASGMVHLEARGILHGDLAARNCMLDDERRLKIGDFGLSRALRANESYQKKSDDPLPIKWMAIESLTDNCFNTATDVWSLGVLMWEVFSLAEAPFAGVPNGLILQRLQLGYRMGRPPYAPVRAHQLMAECWRTEAIMRPGFREIEERLLEMRPIGRRRPSSGIVEYEVAEYERMLSRKGGLYV